MAFWDKEQELCRINKVGTKASFYAVKAVEKNGREFVDVREHFEKADGTLQHTTKGMSIPKDMFLEFTIQIREAAEKFTGGNDNE